MTEASEIPKISRRNFLKSAAAFVGAHLIPQGLGVAYQPARTPQKSEIEAKPVLSFAQLQEELYTADKPDKRFYLNSVLDQLQSVSTGYTREQFPALAGPQTESISIGLYLPKKPGQADAAFTLESIVSSLKDAAALPPHALFVLNKNGISVSVIDADLRRAIGLPQIRRPLNKETAVETVHDQLPATAEKMPDLMTRDDISKVLTFFSHNPDQIAHASLHMEQFGVSLAADKVMQKPLTQILGDSQEMPKHPLVEPVDELTLTFKNDQVEKVQKRSYWFKFWAYLDEIPFRSVDYYKKKDWWVTARSRKMRVGKDQKPNADALTYSPWEADFMSGQHAISVPRARTLINTTDFISSVEERLAKATAEVGMPPTVLAG